METITTDSFEKFVHHVGKIRTYLGEQRQLIQLAIFRELTDNYCEIDPEDFGNDELEFAVEYGYLNPDLSVGWEYEDIPFHENSDMIILTESLHEVKIMTEGNHSDDFKNQFEKEFDAPLDFNHKMFWTNVFGINIDFR